MKDKNGSLLSVSDKVFIPAPTEGDLWHYGDFTGTVITIHDHSNLVTIEIYDGDCFDVEPEMLTIVTDENE